MLLEKYKEAKGSDKSIIEEKLKRYANDVIEDYRADLGNSDVSKEEVNTHYAAYKKVIDEINAQLKTNYRL